MVGELRVEDIEKARIIDAASNRTYSDKYNGMIVKVRDMSSKCCGAYILQMITGEWQREAIVTFDIQPFCDILNPPRVARTENVFAVDCSTDIENITCPSCLQYMDSLDYVERKIEEQFNG